MQFTGQTSTHRLQYMHRESSMTKPTAYGFALPEPSASRFSCSMEMQWSGQMRMHCRHAMHRSMSTVSSPRLRSNVCFLYSGYCRVTLLSKRCLRVIPIPFKIPCPSWGILKTFPLKHRREHEHRTRGDEQPDQAGRHEYLPTEIHELVHPEAREAPSYPLEGENDERRLDAKPQPVEVPEVQNLQGRLPATQEQRGGYRRHEGHRGALGRGSRAPGTPRGSAP